MYGSAPRGADRRGDRRAARRGLPGLQGPAGARHAAGDRSRPASGRSRGSGPTGSTATCCTGAAATRWRTRSPPSSSSGATGKILSWGVSNFDVSDLEEARAIAGDGRIACNQVLYHLQERAIEHAVIPWCEEHRRRRGRLQPVRPRALPRPAHQGRPRARRRSPRRTAPPRARSRSASWSGGPRSSRSPRPRRPEHAAENAGAGDLQLTRGRARPDRRGLSARPSASRAADALASVPAEPGGGPGAAGIGPADQGFGIRSVLLIISDPDRANTSTRG